MTECPQCGYKEKLNTILQHNNMAMYVDDKPTPKDLSGIYNSKEPFITVQGKKLRREDVPTSDMKASNAADKAETKAEQKQDVIDAKAGLAVAQTTLNAAQKAAK